MEGLYLWLVAHFWASFALYRYLAAPFHFSMDLLTQICTLSYQGKTFTVGFAFLTWAALDLPLSFAMFLEVTTLASFNLFVFIGLFDIKVLHFWSHLSRIFYFVKQIIRPLRLEK